jgi:myo-inositol 2-dehydrogenase/D-chiro-inositol 1-dehydrogenase/scyllo-inositol 2-dehydrogenase (NAD+)
MIRLALIGCQNAESYAAFVPRLKGAVFTAAADADLGLASAAQHELGTLAIGQSLEELFSRFGDSFDAVVVDTPGLDRADIARQAVEAGKHLLVETPMAFSMGDADALIESSRLSKVKLMVGNLDRFGPVGQTVKEELESGELGVAGLLRIHRWESSNIGSWRQLFDAQGEKVIDTVRLIRDLDIAYWMFGNKPSEIFAIARRISGSGTTCPDYVQIHLGFPDGGMAIIDYSTSLPQGPGYYFLSMIGSKGAAYADDHNNVNLRYGTADIHALGTSYGNIELLSQLQEFVDSINMEREPRISGIDGRSGLQIADAAAMSIESGQSIRLVGKSYEIA